MNRFLHTLTAKEKQIYDYLVAGYKVNDIAEKMNAKPNAIRTRKTAIYNKLGVNSVAELKL